MEKELSLEEKSVLEHINTYKLAIEEFAESEEDYEFPNSGEIHAAIVMSNILRKAKRKIIMFAGDLNGKVSGDADYLIELENFLKRSGSLELILENNPSVNSKANNVIKKYKNNNVKTYLFDDAIAKKNNFNKPPFHFIVADNRMFRIEFDTETFKAKCNFNSPKIASDLTNLFSKMLFANPQII